MRVTTLVLAASLAHPTIAKDTTTTVTETTPNANHIFNLIHSSMRQWGSSLYHNGMSFFLASVPAGTHLYHGGPGPEPANGTEWLAFEPEHAMLFARMPAPPMGSDPGKGKKGPHGLPLRGPEPRFKRGLGADVVQQPLWSPDDDERTKEGGWLQTYAAAKDLRLLYVDGMSAGKTPNGTLDSFNRILMNDTTGETQIEDEIRRGEGACRLARENWDERLDGVIRMEAGFEIILCNFERDLSLVRAVRVKPFDRHGRRPPHFPKKPSGNDTLHDLLPDTGPWLKGITARYHGIGGNRVTLNYDNFVTAYTYGLDLFGGDSKKYRPRLRHLDSSDLEPIRQDLSTLIMTHEANEPSFNWQLVTDMVIERYANPLKYMASGAIKTTKDLHYIIERSFDPFIDYSVPRNKARETEVCASQFIPSTAPSNTTAAHAITSITRTICATLLDTWTETDLDSAVSKIQGLVEYLSWTCWKECRGCAENEICVIPIWPMGTFEDWEWPSCRDERWPERDGVPYWGRNMMPTPTHVYVVVSA